MHSLKSNDFLFRISALVRKYKSQLSNISLHSIPQRLGHWFSYTITSICTFPILLCKACLLSCQVKRSTDSTAEILGYSVSFHVLDFIASSGGITNSTEKLIFSSSLWNFMNEIHFFLSVVSYSTFIHHIGGLCK